MKLLSGMLAAALLLWGIGASQAAVRIANDRGGRIDRYLDGYEELGASGQTVMIDGLCASACTIVLAMIPRNKICVTSNANLAFHAAWDFGARRRHHEPGSNPDPLCDVSRAGAALDRAPRRLDTADNLPPRQTAAGDVSLLLA